MLHLFSSYVAFTIEQSCAPSDVQRDDDDGGGGTKTN